MEELDAFGLAAMLAANADLEVGAGLASTLAADFDHLAHTRLVDADKRIVFIEVVLDIEGQEIARIVAGEAIGRLGQVIGAEGEELGIFSDAIRDKTGTGQFHAGAHHVLDLDAQALHDLGGNLVRPFFQQMQSGARLR